MVDERLRRVARLTHSHKSHSDTNEEAEQYLHVVHGESNHCRLTPRNGSLTGSGGSCYTPRRYAQVRQFLTFSRVHQYADPTNGR
jgi:hypothetical protein